MCSSITPQAAVEEMVRHLAGMAENHLIVTGLNWRMAGAS
jgi:hypothetical protein